MAEMLFQLGSGALLTGAELLAAAPKRQRAPRRKQPKTAKEPAPPKFRLGWLVVGFTDIDVTSARRRAESRRERAEELIKQAQDEGRKPKAKMPPPLRRNRLGCYRQAQTYPLRAVRARVGGPTVRRSRPPCRLGARARP